LAVPTVLDLFILAFFFCTSFFCLLGDCGHTLFRFLPDLPPSHPLGSSYSPDYAAPPFLLHHTNLPDCPGFLRFRFLSVEAHAILLFHKIRWFFRLVNFLTTPWEQLAVLFSLPSGWVSSLLFYRRSPLLRSTP